MQENLKESVSNSNKKTKIIIAVIMAVILIIGIIFLSYQETTEVEVESESIGYYLEARIQFWFYE